MMTLSRIFTVFVALLAAAVPTQAAPSRSAISTVEDLWSACMPQYQAVGGIGHPDDIAFVKVVATIPPDSLAAVRAQMEPSLSGSGMVWSRCVMDRYAQQLSDQSALPRSTPTPEDIEDYIHACGPEVMAWLALQRTGPGWTDFKKDSKGRNIYVKHTEGENRYNTVQEVIQKANAYANYSSFDLVDSYRSDQDDIRRRGASANAKLDVCMVKRRLAVLGSPIRVRARSKPYTAPKAATPRPPAAKK
jgi:hypothetical protein